MDRVPTGNIRPLAICVFHHCGRILVNEAHDHLKNQSFFRPIGGGIEFGETSADAVAREVREELSLAVVGLRLLGTLENIFTYLGQPGHEIVQVYDGAFADADVYDRPQLPGKESNGRPFTARWLGSSSFSEVTPLHPHGLRELLEAQGLLTRNDD